jgi:holo-[acyl-carrier protein] synthase
MTLVHGIDLVKVSRIESMLVEHGERFLNRVFTDIERRDADAGGARRAEHYAARFAAKEAVFKALGTGWGEGVGWRDIGVERLPGGRPIVHVQGQAASVAQSRGITQWAISLTHTDAHAMASVVGTGPQSHVCSSDEPSGGKA